MEVETVQYIHQPGATQKVSFSLLPTTHCSREQLTLEGFHGRKLPGILFLLSLPNLSPLHTVFRVMLHTSLLRHTWCIYGIYVLPLSFFHLISLHAPDLYLWCLSSLIAHFYNSVQIFCDRLKFSYTSSFFTLSAVKRSQFKCVISSSPCL